MNELQQISERIRNADAILIGASNGLSITEGLHLFADNQAFEELFGDFKRKYGVRSILQGMSARWPSEEEKWAFWSRLIHHYCGGYKESQVMKDLKAIVGDKPYFVVTSNGECHFEMSGFAPENIYEVEGNIEEYHGKRLVVLELGIGPRNQLIKASLMRLVFMEPDATYITINLGEIYITDNIREKSFGLDGYLGEILGRLREVCEK